MRIIIARHGEPDYENDTLTKKGCVEAELLSQRLSKMNFEAIYCSPLGRAKKTASFTLQKLGREAEILPWLQEFRGKCEKPHGSENIEYCWDWLPKDFAKQPLFYDKDRWLDSPELQGTNIRTEWDMITKGAVELLERHGYRRNGLLYDAISPNEHTIALFCHLGLEALLVSYLTGLPPFTMLHAFAPAPSSVTTLVTEERTKGTASFRILSYGDTGHLFHGNEEPSFAARFCECYDNLDQRH